jgi:hypothetical protein
VGGVCAVLCSRGEVNSSVGFMCLGPGEVVYYIDGEFRSGSAAGAPVLGEGWRLAHGGGPADAGRGRRQAARGRGRKAAAVRDARWVTVGRARERCRTVSTRT